MSNLLTAPSTSRISPSNEWGRAPLPFTETRIGHFHRFSFQNSKSIKQVSLVSLFLLTLSLIEYELLLAGLTTLATIGTIVIIAGIAYGKQNGHAPKKILGHIKSISCSPFELLIPSKHNMSNHIFTEGSHLDCHIAYEGDVPVLSLRGSPRNCGRAQGYLLGIQIQSFLKTWGSILWLVIPDNEMAKGLCDNLMKIIPTDILEEMEGVVEGYNMQIFDNGFGEKLTLHELLLLHLVPDTEHTIPSSLAKKFIPPIGCTVVLDRGDEETGIIFGRNMDWPSLGIAGAATLLVRRYRESGKITHEVGIPGLIGTLTSLSNKGLALAMNVALGKTQDHLTGLPAIIMNRILMETCDTVEEVLQAIKTLSPMGPYHLSLGDEKGVATAIHFYQADDNKHYVRTLGDQQQITTTNCRYKDTGSYQQYFNSAARESNIKLIYDNPWGNREEMVTAALRAPLVNNQETVHQVIMFPKKGILKCVFDNGFAGNNEMHTVPFP